MGVLSYMSLGMDKGKVDALDLVISVLREHEATLDKLLERLDTLIEAFSVIQVRLEVLCEEMERTS